MDINHTRNPRKLRDVGVRRFRQGVQVTSGERLHPVMHIHTIPQTKIVIGAVLLARVDYAEVVDYKIRPVVVIAHNGNEVSVRPCTTSQRARHRPGTVILTDLDAAGLSRPTAVIPRTLTLALDEVVAVSGHLSIRDFARIQHPAGHGTHGAAHDQARPLTTPSRITPATLPKPRGAAA